MKFSLAKITAQLVLLTLLIAPTPSPAEYKALLKSGEELYAADYWIDRIDNQVIRLDINGTMERRPRDQFLYIAPVPAGGPRVRTAIKRITFAPKTQPVPAPFATESGDANAAAETDLSRPLPTAGGSDLSSLQSAAEQLDREREAAKEDFRKALDSGDYALRQQARQKILDLTEKRSELLEKVKIANNGLTPDWWRWNNEE